MTIYQYYGQSLACPLLCFALPAVFLWLGCTNVASFMISRSPARFYLSVVEIFLHGFEVYCNMNSCFS